MGGATVSKTGKTPEDVLEQLREQIAAAYPVLQPDSDVSLFKLKEKKEVKKRYKVKLVGPDENPKVEFEEVDIKTPVNLATAAAVGVAANMKTPSAGQWIGCVHLHT